jgi:hypothetical protein
MKVSVISAWASVEPLARFFVSNYAWADRIIALVGPGAWTGPAFPNVEIRSVDYATGRFSEYRKRDAINETLQDLDTDWAIVVDADEYLFTMGSEGPTEDLKPFLAGIDPDANVVEARLWNVFRSPSEKDLDPGRPPLFQRRHGDPNVDPLYVKPLCVRSSADLRFKSGQHELFSNPGIRKATERLMGLHWKYACLHTAIKRKRIRDGLLHHLERWIEPDPATVIARHANDPRLF